MPRYFFDFEYAGCIIFDHDGFELPDDAAAMADAEYDVRNIIGDLLSQNRPVLQRSVVVRNEAREIIGRISFDEIYRKPTAPWPDYSPQI